MQTKLNIKSSSKIFIADSASLKLGNPSTPPPAPTYNLYFYGSPDDEGNNGTIYLQTTNVTDQIPYTITGVSEEDVSIPLTGFFNPGSDALSFSIVADNLTEGPETMVVTLDGITPTVSAALVINDTSTTLVPTYDLQFESGGVLITEANEGDDTVYVRVNTTNLPPEAIIPYTITGVSSEDVNVPLVGELQFNGGHGTGYQFGLTFNISNDLLTEGTETMVVTLDGITPTVSAALVINDTSIASVAPVGDGPILFYDATNTASYPGTGTRIYDLTTNSLTGTLVGGPTFNNVSGDKYFTWTTGDYLYTPTLDEGSVVKTLTGDRPQHSVEVWSYPTVASRIMFTYNGSATENSDYHFSAMELAGGKAYFGLWTTSGLVTTPAPANNVSTNTWHQFVLVYDGTTIIGYVDGVEQSRTTTDINFQTPYEINQGNLRMMFGAFSATNNGGSTQRFSGRWRKMKVYNRALTSSEVLANYNAG